MNVRRNARSLSAAERKAYVNAVLQLKADGTYDKLVQAHLDSMAKLTPPNNPDGRNAAHRGPSFLPWHRQYLVEFEKELQRVDPEVTLPYWDWTAPDAGDPAAEGSIWADDFMGPDGTEESGFRVTDGPFAFDKGRWTLVADPDGGPALRRRFSVNEWTLGDKSGEARYPLPTTSELQVARNDPTYDLDPWNAARDTAGFRNQLEGWSQTGGLRPGVPHLHNRVHVWVGGTWLESDGQGGKESVVGTMQRGSSPNDPIFFLHHAFIDKVWAEWQASRRAADPAGEPHYLPDGNGPAGHNLDDALTPFGNTVRSTLDHHAMGYRYDTEDQVQVPAIFTDAGFEVAAGIGVGGALVAAASDTSIDFGELPPPGAVPSHFLPGGHDHGGHGGHHHEHDHGHGHHDHVEEAPAAPVPAHPEHEPEPAA